MEKAKLTFMQKVVKLLTKQQKVRRRDCLTILTKMGKNTMNRKFYMHSFWLKRELLHILLLRKERIQRLFVGA